MKEVLKIITVTVAILALTAIQIFRPDVIERVNQIMGRFAAWP